MSALYFARNKDVAARRIGSELMILSARESRLFSLNESAAAVWESADGQTPLAQFVQSRLCAEFDVDPAVALSDTEELIRDLSDQGILTIADHPLTEAQ